MCNNRKPLAIISLFCLSLFLNACQSLHNKEDNHYALCKEIKSQLLYNGNTLNSREAWKNRSEEGKLSQAYHEENCS